MKPFVPSSSKSTAAASNSLHESGMSRQNKDSDSFQFLKKAITKEEQHLQDEWQRREEAVDYAWYEDGEDQQ